ncbi:hypothetical protein N7535_002521 [Penicillium sp. DV-2018c]|nr:hypothetical protein N7535_002521 [Penicillium sp. DV-2018c]
MNQSSSDSFTQEIQRLRDDYEKRRARSNFASAGGRRVIDLSKGLIDGVLCYTYWYEHQCIRLADIPGTLSGDILRLQQNLPNSVDEGDYEIIGDQVRPLVDVPPLPELDDDSEELDTILAALPVVEVDFSKHFAKKSKYKSEISNLLKCQGGSCPGVPESSRVIQLLGKSAGGS